MVIVYIIIYLAHSALEDWYIGRLAGCQKGKIRPLEYEWHHHLPNLPKEELPPKLQPPTDALNYRT